MKNIGEGQKNSFSFKLFFRNLVNLLGNLIHIWKISFDHASILICTVLCRQATFGYGCHSLESRSSGSIDFVCAIQSSDSVVWKNVLSDTDHISSKCNLIVSSFSVTMVLDFFNTRTCLILDNILEFLRETLHYILSRQNSYKIWP